MASRVAKIRTPFWHSDATRIDGEPTLAVQCALEEFDRHNWEAERIWGVDRLPSLISIETRLSWWQGRAMLDTAIRDNNAVMVTALVENMVKGMHQMITEAEAAGYAPLSPDIWEAPLSDGRILQIVRTFPAACYQPDDRNVLLWTIEDVARMVDQHDAINMIKDAFPGATITDVRVTVAKEGKLPQEDLTHSPISTVPRSSTPIRDR